MTTVLQGLQKAYHQSPSLEPSASGNDVLEKGLQSCTSKASTEYSKQHANRSAHCQNAGTPNIWTAPPFVLMIASKLLEQLRVPLP